MTGTAVSLLQAVHFQAAMLGGFRIYRSGAPLDVNTWQRPVRSLLKLLLLSPTHRYLRGEIIATLWPESTDRAGQSNLRRTLHLLHRGLGDLHPPPVLRDADWIILNPAYEWSVDVDEFTMCAADAQSAHKLRRALDLYAGELLPEDHFEEWTGPIRQALERRWRDAALHLARLEREEGMLDSARTTLLPLVQSDPLDEEAVRELMAVLLDLGRRSDAVRVYRRLSEQLRDDLGVSPDPQTRRVLEAAGIGPADEIAPVNPRYSLRRLLPLIGRKAQLEAVLRALPLPDTRADASRPAHLVLMGGEAGIGKTRFLAEVAEAAWQRGNLVLAGACTDGQSPYGPIRDALLDYLGAQTDDVLQEQIGQWLPDLSRLIPEVRTRFRVMAAWTGEGDRLRLFHAIATVLGRIAEERGLVLLLDDLHWADPSTPELLHYLAGYPDLQGLTLVGAYRLEEASDGDSLIGLLRELEGSETNRCRATLMTLGPLGQGDLLSLLEAQLEGTCSLSLAGVLHARSGGNPLFATQMARLLLQQERLVRRGGLWTAIAGARALPETVWSVVARRLALLTPEEQTVVQLAAVLGHEFSLAAIEGLWDGESATVLPALERAVEVYLLGETRQGFAFRHPLFREVAYAQLSHPARAAAHARAGRVLEGLYGPEDTAHALVLARHFSLAGEEHREEAASYFMAAGEAAMLSYAWHDAAADYRQVLDLTTHEEVRAAAQEGLGRVLAMLGRYDQALEMVRRAIGAYERLGDLDAVGRVTAHAGRYYADRSTAEQGIQIVRSVLRRHEDVLSPSTRARLYIALSYLLRLLERPESLQAAECACDLARAVDDEFLLADAELRRGTAATGVHGYEGARQILADAIPLAERSGNLEALALLLNNTGVNDTILGRFRDALTNAHRYLDLIERMGDEARVAWARGALANLLFLVGDWDEASRQVRAALTELTHQPPSRFSPYPLLYAGRLFVAQGRLGEAADVLDRSLAHARNDESALRYVQKICAQLDLARGGPAAALERMQPLYHKWDGTKAILLYAEMALAHLALGNVSEAAEVASEGVAVVTRDKLDLFRPDLLRVHGMVLTRSGERCAAEDAFRRSIALARELPNPYAEAQALLELGQMHMSRGNRGEGREAMEDALVIFRRLGARLDSERATRSLQESE